MTFRREGQDLCIANTRFLLLRDGKIIFEGPDEAAAEIRRSRISNDFWHKETGGKSPWLNDDHSHGRN